MIPREFVLFSDSHALQYIMHQHKLSQKHVKWVEFLHSFTFLLKHNSVKSNRVVDVLNRRNIIVRENQVQVLVFKFLKDLYETDIDF